MTPACASQADLRRQQEETAALRAEVTAMQKNLRRIAELELRIEEMRAQVRRRRGSGPARRAPRPGRDRPQVTAVQGRPAIHLPEATLVSRLGATPRRKRLKRHLAGSAGYVVAYWATWCVPCIADAELDRVRALKQALKAQGRDLVVMAIDDVEDLRRHEKADRWVYPAWQRDDGHMEMLPRRFVEAVGLGLPLFVVVDGRGIIRHYLKGGLHGDAVDRLVAAATGP